MGKGKTLRSFLDILDDGDVIPRMTASTRLNFSLHFRDFQALSSCKNR